VEYSNPRNTQHVAGAHPISTTNHSPTHAPSVFVSCPIQFLPPLLVGVACGGVQLVEIPRGDAHLSEDRVVLLHQLERRRALGHAALVHHQHVVVVGDGVQAVRDADHRAVAQLLANRLLRNRSRNIWKLVAITTPARAEYVTARYS
jgi:hypothetical protein